MKAIGLYRYLPIDNPESLVDVDIPKPFATGRDLLVHVKAISVNPVDTKVRAPKDQVEESPRILGWDVAGVVEQVGQDCLLFKAGDEVYYAGSITRPGGNSEFHIVDERIVGRKPRSLDFAHAAALPLTSITAWEGLFDRLNIPHNASKNAKKSILIIGAAGGVGSMATQLAHFVGLTVIGTASRPETIQWAKQHGVTHTIDHHQDFAPQLKKLGIENVNYIFCLNSTARHWNNMTQVLAPEGKICTIVEAKNLDIAALRDKSGTFAWEYMFTRAMYHTSDMVEQHKLLNEIAELIDSGKIQTTLTERLSPIDAEHLRTAHARVEAGSMIGKIVVENFPS